MHNISSYASYLFLKTILRKIRESRLLLNAIRALLILPFAFALPTAALAATKVAFVADQGVGSGARAVLSLIKEEGADIVLIQGDLGYDDDAAAQWEQNLTDALGRDFPVLSLAGNHDGDEWPRYEQFIQQRIDRADGLSCSGRAGIKANCTFENLQVVQVAQGIKEVAGVESDDDYDGFIRSSLSGSNFPWKVCAWHKNQRAMQAYSKSDETGWDIYDACLDSGAMIAAGHAHTYSRTHLMEDYRTQRVAHRSDDMQLEPGRSFAVVTGLGGHDIKPQENDGDWFASIYTQSQGATHGALFCTLEQTTADCYFKAIDGSVPDSFTLRTGSGSANRTVRNTPSPDGSPDVESVANASDASGVFRRTDKDEYRWITRDDSGQWSSSMISESCAMALGGAKYSGNWGELIERVPRVNTMPSPCERSVAQISPPPPAAAGADSGFVFSRTDKRERRWVEVNTSGQMGSVWIDDECASQLGGTQMRGDYDDLMAVAPAQDSIDNPCVNGGNLSVSQQDNSNGYVFARTDKTEYRWIDRDDSGDMGNVWIDEACADRLGGVTTSGDWYELNAIAPGFDTLISPCY